METQRHRDHQREYGSTCSLRSLRLGGSFGATTSPPFCIAIRFTAIRIACTVDSTLSVEMPRVPAAVLVSGAEPDGSAVVADRIAAARAWAAMDRGRANGRSRGRQLRRACRLDEAASRRVTELAEIEFASGRGTERLLRVARTIADLARSPVVEIDHIDEASLYRPTVLRDVGTLAS